MAELLYEELSGQIRDAAYAVYSYLGPGFLEKVYENALAYELRKLGLKCLQQIPLKVYYKDNVIIGDYDADLLVEDKIIVELKVVESLANVHFSVVKHYLTTTKLQLGLLINFGPNGLDFKRVIWTQQ